MPVTTWHKVEEMFSPRRAVSQIPVIVIDSIAHQSWCPAFSAHTCHSRRECACMCADSGNCWCPCGVCTALADGQPGPCPRGPAGVWAEAFPSPCPLVNDSSLLIKSWQWSLNAGLFYWFVFIFVVSLLDFELHGLFKLILGGQFA